jgi:hypothetical protein
VWERGLSTTLKDTPARQNQTKKPKKKPHTAPPSIIIGLVVGLAILGYLSPLAQKFCFRFSLTFPGFLLLSCSNLIGPAREVSEHVALERYLAACSSPKGL